PHHLRRHADHAAAGAAVQRHDPGLRHSHRGHLSVRRLADAHCRDPLVFPAPAARHATGRKARGSGLMLSADFVIATAVGYVGLLFLIAYVGDRRASTGSGGLLRSPFVYTLAISVYCTSWTFYGAVGSAARNGLEYLAIYLGPTLVFVGWWFVLRKLVRISHNQRLTSVADLLSSRFGKSSRLAVLVTVIAVIGIAPY